MSGFTITPSKFRKVQASPAVEAGLEKATVVEAIVKVSEPGYVPPSVELRSRIDQKIITGETSSATLMALENDPKVESVSIGRQLRIIE